MWWLSLHACSAVLTSPPLRAVSDVPYKETFTTHLNRRASRSTSRLCEPMVPQPRSTINIWNLIPCTFAPSYLSKRCIDRKCFQRLKRGYLDGLKSGFYLDSRAGTVKIILEMTPVVKNQIEFVKCFRIILEERCCRNIRYYYYYYNKTSSPCPLAIMQLTGRDKLWSQHEPDYCLIKWDTCPIIP